MDYLISDQLFLDYQQKLYSYLRRNEGNEMDFILKQIEECKIKIKDIEEYSIMKEEKKLASKFPFNNEKSLNNYQDYLSQIKERANYNLSTLKNTIPQLKSRLAFYEINLKKFNGATISKGGDDQKVEWIASEIELVELIKSLIEVKAIKYKSEKEVFHFFQKIFNIKFDKREKLQSIRKRKIDKTHFIPKLEEAFSKWFDKNL